MIRCEAVLISSAQLINSYASVSDFLRKRIRDENPDTPEEEVELRLNKIGYILGQKVSSTRRTFRTKNIAFPTADYLKEERRKKKKEEKRRRKQMNND